VLYHWHEFGRAAVAPARAAADLCRLLLHPCNPLAHTPGGRGTVAVCEMFELLTRRYRRPSFGITCTTVDGRPTAVCEEVVWQTPFCRLLHFRRAVARRDPRLLVVAPLSGHFATVLRGTVEALLPEHDVYVTDWQDAREVPLSAGRFDLDDCIDTIADVLRWLGGRMHVLAVCQPCVPVLAATALMEADGDPRVPATLVLAGGPIDARINRTLVNMLVEARGTDWFRRNVITTVPAAYAGHGRAVYPGFLQLSGFMSMNLGRHMRAPAAMFAQLVRVDGDFAAEQRAVYDEYLAMMDLTAEFYLQTLDTVFVSHLLPRALMKTRGRRVDLAAIRRPALLTIEGENDDVTGRGQCRVAQTLCGNVPESRKLQIESPGAGHYDIFNGARFRTLIAPRIAHFLRAATAGNDHVPMTHAAARQPSCTSAADPAALAVALTTHRPSARQGPRVATLHTTSGAAARRDGAPLAERLRGGAAG
jgi:poly(3-hydroxybutyrate) depolymerase